ncbi:hypothetical protein FH972_023158 [Carpinus fangiana]|uniref:Uncharacterized protein n=1 Tax=Carpinus fangiana TaxID=176857 RepID=A0A5N6KUC7_9ROSI|nr:hypothetical protein FH972_023158 [Carpinus fangiana]
MAQDPRALLQQADKAASGASGGFSFFGGRTEKYERAAELYTQAANSFRLQKQGKEAGLAFERAAAIQINNLQEPDDAANTYQEAFKSYKATDPEDAIRVLQLAVTHYTLKGNFRRAATQQQNVAECLEAIIGDNKRAIDAYEKVGECLTCDSLANKAFLKLADLSAEEGNYQRSIENYEKVARSSLNSNLMKWSVKEYFLKAGICHLTSGDMVATKRAIEQYTEMDPTFASTRECKLLNDLVESVEQGDQETFSDQLFQYDQMSKLDKWKTKLLLKVKDNIESQGEDFS